jgi:protein-tyrosine-phosphatase
VHAALGDPTRLAVVDELVLGDRSPGELAEALGVPTNLMAHHMRVLHEAGLVAREPSEADRRRAYVRLVPSVLAGLVPAPALQAPRVVFVCTRNSARSQLAAALWSGRSEVAAASAGTRPADRVHPKAMSVARRHALRLDPWGTRGLDEVLGPDDLVVAVCDRAHEELPPARPRLHWSVPDPVPAGTVAAFERAYAEIEQRVEVLARAVETAGTRS